MFQSGQHSACLTSKKAGKRQCAARFSGREGITDQSDRIKMMGSFAGYRILALPSKLGGCNISLAGQLGSL
jgi:hypothetical protein